MLNYTGTLGVCRNLSTGSSIQSIMITLANSAWSVSLSIYAIATAIFAVLVQVMAL